MANSTGVMRELKRVNSENMEFGNELFAVIPYAYYHYLKGNLVETISAPGTNPFYYFSTTHTIIKDKRHWTNIKKSDIPNVHVNDFTGKGEWHPPPYKDEFKNNFYVYDKPIVVISNKHNVEWGSGLYNYLDVDVLFEVFEVLKNRYTIFYNGSIPEYLRDDQKHMHTAIDKVIRRLCPYVKFISDIEGDFNTVQLCIYANAGKFISVQGGNSILASYFGGENIVYAVRGNELNNNFYGKLTALSGCNIKHVMSYTDLLGKINDWCL